jgi:hypothetical protein
LPNNLLKVVGTFGICLNFSFSYGVIFSACDTLNKKYQIPMEVLKTNQIDHGLKLASLLIDFILILTTSD